MGMLPQPACQPLVRRHGLTLTPARRYRERKKQKFHEMEATIEQLTKQLQSLQVGNGRRAPAPAAAGSTQGLSSGDHRPGSGQGVRGPPFRASCRAQGRHHAAQAPEASATCHTSLALALLCLQALQSRNQILEGLNGELQAQLVTKEKEVERLRVALDVAAERSLGSAPSSPRYRGRCVSGVG